ncbi:MAG: hypothetical protein IT541_10040 [Hyphomicrobiales bacterium]|nr:hypothetical protein [Hyphomicrobiales bacterium]
MPATFEYAWAAADPSPLKLNEFISTHSALWPQWDWRSLIEAGIQARNRQDSPEDALESIRSEFNFSANNQILVAAWIAAGLITKAASV